MPSIKEPYPLHVIDAAAEEVTAPARRVKRGEVPNDEAHTYDHVWVVIDTDVAVREGYWNDVLQSAKVNKVKLAHSSPCIESWFLFHFSPTTRADLVNRDAAKKAVQIELGEPYSTNRRTAEAAIPKLLKNWPEAVKNAMQVRQYRQDACTNQPANPSTEIDLLVRALDDAALEHNRKL